MTIFEWPNIHPISGTLKYRLLLLIIIQVNWMWAQQLDVSNFTTRDGLPESFVYDLAQDEHSRIWIATGKGLTRFNGSSFRVFNSSDGLAEDFVTCLVKAPNGDFITGHYKGGISHIDEEGQLIAQYAGTTRVNDVVLLQGGRVLGVFDDGARLYTGGKEQHIWGCKVGIHSPRIALPLGSGQVLVASEHAAWVWTLSSEEIKTDTVVHWNLDHHVTMVSDKDSGAYICDGKSVMHVPSRYSDQSPNHRDSDISFPSAGQNLKLLLATKHGGIWFQAQDSIFEVTIDTLTHNLSLTMVLKASHGLPVHAITCAFSDSDGDMWFGTRGRGLFRLNLPNSYFLPTTLFPVLERPQAVLEINNGLLIGTSNGLVYTPISTKGGLLTVGEMETWISGESVTALCLGVSDEVWAGTASGKLFHQSGQGMVESGILKSNRDYINHLSMDANLNLWVAQRTRGVSQVDLSQSEVVQQWNTANGLPHNNILSIVHDSRKGHWFATDGTKLARLDQSGWSYFGMDEGLRSLDLTGVVVERSGTVWVATNDRGIFYRKDNEFEHLTLPQAWLSSRIIELVQVSDRLLIALTNRGAQWIDSQSKSVIAYHQFSQLIGSGSRHSGISLSPNGSLIQATTTGVHIFPLPLELTLPKSRTLITKITVDGRTTSSGDTVFDHTAKHLHFLFEQVNLSKTTDERIWYMLDGYDTSWQGPAVAQEAHYTNLDPGAYTLLVRSVDAGPSHGHDQTFSFYISPPFWQTWWFLTFSAFVIVVSIWSFLRWREHRLRSQNKLLETLVAERTDQLQKQNDDIRQFTYSVTHDLKAPANNVVALIRMIRESNLSTDKYASFLDMLDQTGNHMRSSLDRLMLLIRNYDERGVHEEVLDVAEVLDEVTTNIHGMIEESNTAIVRDIQAERFRYNRDDFASILHNLLTNAIKYRSPDRDPAILIRTEVQGDQLKLEITDNGLGMDMQQDGAKLFAKFERIHTNAEGSGMGLYLVKELIERSGGKIQVKSTLGEGSTFTVLLLSHTKE